ncbi:hypothetical protein LUZ60_009377 [Juncus effusus]|nr:hypothetical protein LUZ60_009377 [Juncus effusus]
MDTSSPAVFANGEVLKTYQGCRVRAVLQVMRNEGGVLWGQLTDGGQISVKGAQSAPVTHFMEVIGIADGPESIRAEICTDFGPNFDKVAYNGLCQLANGKFKNLFL